MKPLQWSWTAACSRRPAATASPPLPSTVRFEAAGARPRASPLSLSLTHTHTHTLYFLLRAADQDYTVSADHYAVMNTAIHAMLLQSGEDGAAGTIVLLPAWPCSVDVSFKLWGVLNTSVEVVYSGGALQSLAVEPPARRGAVRFANCVTAATAQNFK